MSGSLLARFGGAGGRPDPEFLRPALETAERALGLLDRDPGSKTYGCFDRSFWKYNVIDYPSAWFQVGSELLAGLYVVRGTPFCDNEKLRAWAAAGVSFSLAWLNPDGSAMEVYPFERSYCATSFLASHCAAVVQGLSLEAADLAPLRYYLRGRIGNGVSNQIAAAALAQFRLGDAADGQAKLATLMGMQMDDGCFPEYGGLDIGYLSITLSLLARLDAEFPGSVDAGRARRAVKLIEESLDDHGCYDPARCTRGTQFVYPFGLAYFGSSALARLRHGIGSGRLLLPRWMDDRYFMELALDYLLTSLWLGAAEGDVR